MTVCNRDWRIDPNRSVSRGECLDGASAQAVGDLGHVLLQPSGRILGATRAHLDVDSTPSGKKPVIRPDANDESIRSAMTELTSGFDRDTAIEQTLSRVTAAAVEMVDGVDYADVMVISGGQSRSVSPTASFIVDLDAVQINLGQGPCLEAAVGGAMIRCTDMRSDPRWPGFATAALDSGVHSMLAFQLLTHGNGVGALNLFGRAPRAENPAAEAIGALLATVATMALMTADRGQQFASALASRDVIGQAKGILMNHFQVDAVRAFDMLKSLSQDGNIPLRTIAQQIIDSYAA